MQNNDTIGGDAQEPSFDPIKKAIEDKEREIKEACGAIGESGDDLVDLTPNCDKDPCCGEDPCTEGLDLAHMAGMFAGATPLHLSEEDRKKMEAILRPLIGAKGEELEIASVTEDDGEEGELSPWERDDISGLFESIATCLRMVLRYRYGIDPNLDLK